MTSSDPLNYVIVVQAPAFALADGHFATESAFAIHLKELREALGPRFKSLVLVAPQFTPQVYEARKATLGVLSAQRDGVEFMPAHSLGASAFSFWFSDLPRVCKNLRHRLREPAIVHSGMSDDIRRPLMAALNLVARLRKRPVIFIVDIDFRQDTRRYYQLGLWRTKRYLAHRFLFDPVKWIQVWLAPRLFQLVLLKSSSMVRDFGRGRQHVKNFYDTVHSSKDVLPEALRAAHFERLKDPSGSLNVVYFGRFVAYKGLKVAVEAIRIARSRGIDVTLTLIGEGECQQDLVQQVKAAALETSVIFQPPVRYGPDLFNLLANAHVTVASPLIEDTPRAAFDSMARGLPLVASDINYFSDLARESGAIALFKWSDPESLAEELIALSRNRGRIAEMAARGMVFAENNTQSIWLARRVGWVADLLAARA